MSFSMAVSVFRIKLFLKDTIWVHDFETFIISYQLRHSVYVDDMILMMISDCPLPLILIIKKNLLLSIQ